MIGVRTLVPPLCVCEFMMTLSSRLSQKKNRNVVINKPILSFIIFCHNSSLIFILSETLIFCNTITKNEYSRRPHFILKQIEKVDFFFFYKLMWLINYHFTIVSNRIWLMYFEITGLNSYISNSSVILTTQHSQSLLEIILKVTSYHIKTRITPFIFLSW